MQAKTCQGKLSAKKVITGFQTGNHFHLLNSDFNLLFFLAEDHPAFAGI